jgi:asparagine synthase (glutamine-hydrolysing)
MCGIYGTLNFDESASSDVALLHRMGRAILHRGPDDEGYLVSGELAMGMRRLSIIDLSGGHQPIPNEDETIWVICNGEIYNFKGLRDALEQRGHRFRTKSDTEVLVHLYEEDGPEFVNRLRGMFAIALWDSRRRRLVLARDRLGKKPLYVRREPRRLLFASEIKSILEDPSVPRRIDPMALEEYLALGYVPAPSTLFEGIEKILPGYVWTIEQETVRDQSYWDLSFASAEEASEEEWAERIREKLLESVKIRLVSDVPLGAFLSGGIDSSALVAAMSRCTDQPVKTYSIGFEGEDSYYNELPFAGIVASAFGTHHHEIMVRPKVAELMPQLVWHLDEPIADSAFVTTFLVSQLARKSVTVILSGVGGDELFGGYRRYLGDSLLRYYAKLPSFVQSGIIPAVLRWLPQDRRSGWKNNVRYASAFVNSLHLDPLERYLSYVEVFPAGMRRQLLAFASPSKVNGHVDGTMALSRHFAAATGADGLHQIMYADIKTSLTDDLLALTDKMSMAASIECRAPFMDHELVELAARMPSSLKVRGLTMKYVLKKALEPWLPKSILHRRKRGFGAPVGGWLRRELDSLVQETLSPGQIRKRGLLNPVTVQQILASHRSQEKDYTDGLLALITLELWCQAFLDGRNWKQDPMGRMQSWQVGTAGPPAAT